MIYKLNPELYKGVSDYYSHYRLIMGCINSKHERGVSLDFGNFVFLLAEFQIIEENLVTYLKFIGDSEVFSNFSKRNGSYTEVHSILNDILKSVSKQISPDTKDLLDTLIQHRILIPKVYPLIYPDE